MFISRSSNIDTWHLGWWTAPPKASIFDYTKFTYKVLLNTNSMDQFKIAFWEMLRLMGFLLNDNNWEQNFQRNFTHFSLLAFLYWNDKIVCFFDLQGPSGLIHSIGSILTNWTVNVLCNRVTKTCWCRSCRSLTRGTDSLSKTSTLGSLCLR